jgi:hypothetical protein
MAGIEKIDNKELDRGKYIAENLPNNNKANNRIARAVNKFFVSVSALAIQKKRDDTAAIQRRDRQKIKNK